MPTFDELIKTVSDKATLPFSRVGAISALVRLKDTRAGEYLIDALSDENHYVRREAARALGQLKAVDAVDPLVTLVDTDVDDEVRRNAITALGIIGDDSVLDTLMQAMEDTSYLIRRAAKMSVEQIQQRVGGPTEPVEHSEIPRVGAATTRFETSTSPQTKETSSTDDIPSYRQVIADVSSKAESAAHSATVTETSFQSDDTTLVPPSLDDVSPQIDATHTQRTVERPTSTQRPYEATWTCKRCGDKVPLDLDRCQTCGGLVEEQEIEERESAEEPEPAEQADVEMLDEGELDASFDCPKCGEAMQTGYLFTKSDEALVFAYMQDEEDKDVIVGRGSQLGCICLTCKLIAFPFR